MNEVLSKFQPKDALECLPQPTFRLVHSTLGDGITLMSLAGQLAAQPSEGLAGKGALTWPSDLWPRIVAEMHLLICTDDQKYVAWREKLKNEGSIAAKTFVFISSNAVAATLGVVPALCVPFVALIIAAAIQMSVSGWCVAFSQGLSTTGKSQNTEPK